MISGIAGWNLVMHAFDLYWIIIPERGPSLTAESGTSRDDDSRRLGF